MPRPLPPAIAAALARVRSEHAAGATPAIPFVPETRTDARQLEAFGPPPADWKTWEKQLLEHAGPVLEYLGLTHQELRNEAQRIPSVLHELSHDEPYPGYAARMVAAAVRRFGEPVPGETLEAQLARVIDPRYWRRFIVGRVRQALELLHLKLGLIGAGARSYCSEQAQAQRRMQLQMQAQWLKETMVRAVIDGKTVEIPLEQVAKGVQHKLARLYAFIKAIDTLAVEANLTSALLTTTLEGEWHANPKHAKPDHRWNGATPQQANRELGQRFQNVRRDLEKQGIRLSGLWAGEPHQDGCPHRHFWVIYAPQDQAAVFAAFLKYFPGKLKLRRSKRKKVIFETREDALLGRCRRLAYAKEGAQVDVSIINRKKGSGASYVLKYVQKAVLADATYASACKPRAGSVVKTGGRRKAKVADGELQHRLQNIDAHRATWRMRSFQFYGIKDCLGLWEELRRLKEPPAEAQLRALWRAARGGDARGSLKTGEQRGDALAFLKLLGGLAAAAQPEQRELVAASPQRARVYTVPTVTRYGEAGARIEGVELVRPAASKGDEAETLERLVTRPVRWELVPRDCGGEAAGKGPVEDKGDDV